MVSLVGGVEKASSGAEGLGFRDALEGDTGDGLGVEVVGEGLSTMAGREEGATDALGGEVADDPFDEGTPSNGSHGFGNVAKEVADAGALAAGEEEGGDVRQRGHSQMLEY